MKLLLHSFAPYREDRMKTSWLAAFLAVLFGTTAYAETFDDPSKEQEVNGSYSWTLSGDSTVKYVSSPQDIAG